MGGRQESGCYALQSISWLNFHGGAIVSPGAAPTGGRGHRSPHSTGFHFLCSLRGASISDTGIDRLCKEALMGDTLSGSGAMSGRGLSHTPVNTAHTHVYQTSHRQHRKIWSHWKKLTFNWSSPNILSPIQTENTKWRGIHAGSIHWNVLNEGHRISTVNLRGMHNSERVSLILLAFRAIRLHGQETSDSQQLS